MGWRIFHPFFVFFLSAIVYFGAMKNRTFYSFLVLSAFFHFSSITAQEIGSPFIRNYSPKEYDNTSQVWASFRDDKGLMYFGMTGGGGIVEYDGRTWRVIDVPTTVFSFVQDTKKRIYTGIINDFGYIAPDERGQNRFVSLRPLLPQKDLKFKAVWFAHAIGDDIYFMCIDAIFKYSASEEKITTYFTGPEGKFLSLFPHEGNMYAMQNGRGLLRVGVDSLELLTDFFKDKPLRHGLSLSADSLIVPTRKHGMFIYRFTGNSVTPFPVRDTNFVIGENNSLYASTILPDKNMVFGSNNEGAFLVSPQGSVLQKWRETNQEISSIYNIYPSPDGNLWFGTENGIIRTEQTTAWSYWGRNSGLEGTVMDILRFEGTIYIATLRGIYYINKDNTVKKVEGIPREQSWRFFVYSAPDGKKILLAGVSGGIFQIVGTKATAVRAGSHITAFAVTASDPSRIMVSSNPTLVVMRYEKEKWKDEGIVEGVNDNLQELVEDSNGDWWIATYAQGVIRLTPDPNNILKPKKIRYYTETDGLPTPRISSPYKIDGDIVFTTEKGLYVHDPASDRFVPYVKINSLLPNGDQDVLVIRKLNDGKIVILPGTNKNHPAGYLQPAGSGIYSWIDKPFLKIPQMAFESVYQDSGGILWIGGSEGLYRYDASVDDKNYGAVFHALIRKVSVKGDSVVNFGGNVSSTTIEYKNNDVKFEFAAPFYDDESKTTFSHQLIGYENSWSPWSSDGAAIYTNLDEGNYTFRAKGKNLYGNESVVAEYSIRILPPPYRTWWAFSSYFLFLGVSIAVFDRWNKRRLRRQYEKEHEIEQQRQQNFSRMLMERQEHERQRIARELHDSLGQELLILKHRIQLNKRQEGMTEELKNIFEEHSASASDILTQLRNISHDLRPPELDRLGLTESIKAILQRVRNTKQMEIVGEIDEIDGFFSKNEEINLIRILQEALNNIMKHAGAERTEIIVRLNDDELFFTIKDNGKGMSINANASAGMGMHDIEDRARMLGGVLMIESSPGEGTRLMFYFSKNKK